MNQSKSLLWCVVALLALGLGCGDDTGDGRAPRLPVAAKEKPEKEQAKPRVIGALNVAPAEVPSSLPMIGEEGVDEFGYPKKMVDKVGLLALLRNKKYDELTEHIESLQKEFEADFKKEYWPFRAIESFSTADPRLRPLLDEWVEKHPQSFAPYAARGNYLNEVGWEYRGHKFADKTSDEQLKAMRGEQAFALEDLQKALRLNPKVMIAYTEQLSIFRHGKKDQMQQMIYKKAYEVCPSCYLPALWRSWDLQPRWGGSFEQMQAFVDKITANKKKNPKLALLQGSVAYEKCKVLRKQERYPLALEQCDDAIKHGPSEWYYFTRGRVYHRMKKFDLAVADYERALELAPQRTNVLEKYARVLCAKKIARFKDAGEALLTLLRLDPALEKADELRTYMIDKLVAEGTRLYGEGNKDEAASHYELAAKLDPDHADVAARLAKTKAGEDPRDEHEVLVAQLVARSLAEPNNIDVVIELDKELFKKRELKEIVSHWDRFIEANPDVGRAYLERGGTYSHLRDRKNSLRDNEKACELGEEKGCQFAARLKRGR
jgi:tetratricopeptide (TPR) repeat protein